MDFAELNTLIGDFHISLWPPARHWLLLCNQPPAWSQIGNYTGSIEQLEWVCCYTIQ